MDYINYAISNLEQICLDCKDFKTEECVKSKCNIGFALSAMSVIQINGYSIVQDGFRLIPKEDVRYYNKAMVARCTAAICKTCKQCMKGHNENCSISLARRSIESTVLKELIDYPGNMLGYIIKVEEQDREFADLIRKEIQVLE